MLLKQVNDINHGNSNLLPSADWVLAPVGWQPAVFSSKINDPPKLIFFSSVRKYCHNPAIAHNPAMSQVSKICMAAFHVYQTPVRTLQVHSCPYML